MINLHVHQFHMVIHIYIQSHENWFTDTFIMAKLQILDKFKSNNSYINDAVTHHT